MDPALARERMEGARVAHLATVRPDGRPHVVPCCFALVGDVAYTAVDAKPKSTLALQRLKNLSVNDAVSLLVDYYDEDWSRLWWIRIDGRARIVSSGSELEEALGALTAKYEQYRSGVEVRPPVIALDVERWTSWP